MQFLKFAEWNPVDCENFYISPGVIDFNIRRDWEDASQMTQAAVSGGVTLVVEDRTENFTEEATKLHCDLGMLAVVSQPEQVLDFLDSGIFGIKTYLFKPCDKIEPCTDIQALLVEAAEAQVPVFVSSCSPDLRMYHMASPCHFIPIGKRSTFKEANTSSMFVSAYSTEVELSDEEVEIEPVRKLRTNSAMPTRSKGFNFILVEHEETDNIFRRRRKMTDIGFIDEDDEATPDLLAELDYQIRVNEQSIEYLSQVEQDTYAKSGNTQFNAAKPPSKDRMTKFRPTPIIVQKAYEEDDKDKLYFNYLANFPDPWETHGVKRVVKACANLSIKVHLCNLSSVSAINYLIKQKGSKFTCDTTSSFLCFTDADVAQCDTRLKNFPPVRNKRNCNLLWDLLKLKGVDSITSQHLAVPPQYKFLHEGSFKLAVCGISSLGFSMQQVWTKLRMPCTSASEYDAYIVRLANWMSIQPAKQLGVWGTRGSISRGKYADLVIWDPHARELASSYNCTYPEVFPFTSQSFYGVIHEVLVRGAIAYHKGRAKGAGKVVAGWY
mmetsp:Transcript_29295/g.52444  ORF Transcript_29295/g.52444 Transcript_29295/m.52444 type:complete len:550 (+) Transcript_29295:161-1810(+)